MSSSGGDGDVARLADALTCVHFPIATGLTPSVQELREAVDNVTCDWRDEPAPAPKQLSQTPQAPSAAHAAPKLELNAQVQAAVMQLWAQFQKDAENSISREEYQGFQLRIMRALLPGLGAEREQKLSSNAWEEDAGGIERMQFAQFFDAMIRLAKTWTDWREPTDAAHFLDELLKRTTQVLVTIGDTGEVIAKAPNIMATFWSHPEMVQNAIPDSEFGLMVTVSFKGTLPQFSVSAEFDTSAKWVQMGTHLCWFNESVADPEEDAAPNDGIRREWIALDDVVPIGRTALVALKKAQADAAQGEIPVDVSQASTAPANMVEGARVGLQAGMGVTEGYVSVEVAGATSVAEARAVVMSGGHQFGAADLLAAALSPHSNSPLVFVRPTLRSPLYKLRKIREELGLEQLSAAEAATPGGAVTGDPNGPALPSLPALLESKMVLDPVSGLAKPVKNEKLLMSATLASLAETFLYDGPDSRLAASGLETKSLAEEMAATRSVRNAKAGYLMNDFASTFPQRVEGLENQDTDFLGLAKTPPVTLWILGQCDSLGEYKTEVCRRLADRMDLQWLKPQTLLEMAVKTPERFRSPLMARCVEQLQRGMEVSTADALRLALETMASAKCKTNGYVLDFPPISPSERDQVFEFIEKVRLVSQSPEVRKQEFLNDDITLAPLEAEPEPPAPPPDPDAEGAEGAGGAEGAEGEAVEAEAEVFHNAEAVEGAPVSAEGEAVMADAAEGEGGEAEQVEEAPPPPPLETPVPNPWVNMMPRRVITLGMDSDELAVWRLALLKERHAERERLRKKREEDGEDPEEPEAEEPPEPVELTVEEEEQNEEFASKGNDVLLTMEKYVPVPSLEPPAPGSVPPPIPDPNVEIKLEEFDEEVFADGELNVSKYLRDKWKVPMLTLHADGRTPETMVDLLEAASGKFKGPRVGLPVPIEGADGVGDANELLTAPPVDERKAPRQWSLWQQHCPVSLYDRKLVRGQNEFAVTYAGKCLLLANEDCRRRFCTWPKLFLTESPKINAAGMALGFVLLSPGGFRAEALAEGLRKTYDFDIVNIAKMLAVAMDKKAIDEPVPEVPEGEEPAEAPQIPPEEVGILTMQEKKDLRTGNQVGTATIVRVIGEALKIKKNIDLVSERKKKIEEAKAALEAAADDEEKKAELAIEVDDNGEPVVTYSEPLAKPSKGFVLIGYPETGEQFEAIQDQLQLELERIIILKKDPDDEEALEIPDFLSGKGFHEDMPLGPILEKYDENVATLEAVETAPAREEIPLHAEEQAQLVAIRKKIDPFYPIVEDPTVGLVIPDPDEFDMDAAVEAAKALEEETGEKQDAPEPPAIPWGLCGPYCPVTLAKDCWLYPGSKELQNVYRNSVYSFASEAVRDEFMAEPIKFIPSREPTLPPPRILITGATGSGVDEQCKQLSKAYGIPVIEFEEQWRKRVETRIEDVKKANREKAAAEKSLEPMLGDGDAGPTWPEGWTLPVEKAEGEEEEEAAPEEAEPEEDGLDEEAREKLYIDAVRDVLGRHIGACIINAKFEGASFGEVDPEADADPTRALQSLLVKAQRLPDLILIMKAKNDVAARNVFDLDEIDRVHEERVAKYLKEKEAAELAQEADEEVVIPEPPEDLVVEPEEEGQKESDRVKAKFVEKKKAQQTVLQEFVEAIKTARAPFEKVSSDRGAAVAHKSIRWHSRPFMEQRTSLLVKSQVKKLTPSKATDVLSRALAQPSYFGDSSPMCSDTPLFVGRPDTFQNAVSLRGRCFYPRTAEEQETFLARPQDFVHLPPPSPFAVNPCICVTGPPLSGKTTLAKLLAKGTGAVYLSVPEVIGQLCHELALPCALSREITSCMRRGKKIPPESIVEALRMRMAAPDVVKNGWILDDFPITKQQAEALSEVGIVPHRVFSITIPEALVFARATALGVQNGGEGVDLVQTEVALQRQRLDAFARTAPLAIAYYSLSLSNVCELDGTKSVWATEDRALKETSRSISQRLEYYRRTADSKAACIHGLGFTPDRVQRNESTWRRYCPVTLTLGNELVLCKDPRFTVEYKSRIYWLSSAQNMQLFLGDPDSFLAVPLPQFVPYLLPLVDRIPAPICMLEEEEDAEAKQRMKKDGISPNSFCPVALVDRKELVKAVGCYIVQHQGKFWSMESKKACEKFMRRPMRYVARAKLPAKKPALPGKDQVALLSALTTRQDGKGLQPAEMLTFMQASVAEIICQAMVESGERRPLYPGKSAQESMLMFLANFLRAKNVLDTEMKSLETKERLDRFQSDCALPAALKELTKRKEAYETAQEGVWTSADARLFQDLCQRFDVLFNLPAVA